MSAPPSTDDRTKNTLTGAGVEEEERSAEVERALQRLRCFFSRVEGARWTREMS